MTKRVQPPGDEVGQAIDAAAEVGARRAPSGDDRPSIQVQAGALVGLVAESQTALLKARRPVYQRADDLVRPVVDVAEASAKNGQKRKTSIARLRRLAALELRYELAEAADWERWSARKREWVACDPPLDVAATLLTRAGEWRFPRVVGVLTTPTIRPDGSLLLKPGYDPATGLLLAATPPMPPIPERPSKADAEAALGRLKGLLDEFPLVDAPSLGVALSALLTPVVRGAFPTAPLHVARAPVAGSGKSFLFDLAAALAIGDLCPVMTYTPDPAEFEKRLGAEVMTGQALMSIDNVNGALGGDLLCQLVERPVVKVRVLGKSEMVRVEARATTIFATGNNIEVLGDMQRRHVLAQLDPEMERPELRSFRRNPVEEVLADRGAFLADALTVVRAWLLARDEIEAEGCSDGRPTPLASFEGWSQTVREAMMWIDEALDPVATMEAGRQRASDVEELAALLVAWREAVGVDADGRPRKVTMAQLAQLAVDSFGGAWQHPALHEAVISVAAERFREGAVSTKRLAKAAARAEGRLVGGLRLRSEPGGGARARWWWVEAVTPANRAGLASGGLGGVGGVVQPFPQN